MKNEWNKWKNHFKGGEQEDAYIHQDTNSFITPSLHLCFFQVHNVFHIRHEDVFSLPNAFTTNKILKQNKDVGMGL